MRILPDGAGVSALTLNESVVVVSRYSGREFSDEWNLRGGRSGQRQADIRISGVLQLRL
jgi:hypothetical protein